MHNKKVIFPDIYVQKMEAKKKIESDKRILEIQMKKRLERNNSIKLYLEIALMVIPKETSFVKIYKNCLKRMELKEKQFSFCECKENIIEIINKYKEKAKNSSLKEKINNLIKIYTINNADIIDENEIYLNK